MSNCGPLGWVSDEAGYRYQPTHPETGRAWPEMPARLLEIWRLLAPDAPPPEACLINLYDANAKMGLHQDRDEQELAAPVVSLSLGDSALFRLGGADAAATPPAPSAFIRRRDDASAVRPGSPSTAIDRIAPGSSTLLAGGGRINLTLRRVTRGRLNAICRRSQALPSARPSGRPWRRRPCAGRSTRSPIVQPLWTTWETVPAGTVSSGASNIA